MIHRRSLVLASGALLATLEALAQAAGKVYRVGWFGFTAYNSPDDQRLLNVFTQRLGELGFAEGRNLVFEWRYAEGRMERYADFAAEMVRLKADLVVALSTPAIRAVMAASRSLPIVAFPVPDPVRAGLVTSLARPGGQLTGMANFPDDLVPKRLELLKAALPAAARVAYPGSPASLLLAHGSEAKVAAVQAAEDEEARVLGVNLLRLDLDSAAGFEKVAAALRRERPDAIILQITPVNMALQREWIALSSELRAPLFVAHRGFGGMLSYGLDFFATARKVAEYVAKILGGANPGELPMEQPMNFEFVINLKVARAMGITIPEAARLRADEVIE
ncbi:hypothetical protein HHL11_14855 [Ramlibacter sp. G-1-2-2]|uniref:ABC transporter substrate-binding protein n=1 Tax=Ramlibacter agri TaxID=2728837 RepID=A0A848H232_9BURK|nr:ABC transporter substrate-binding protein [Ramlibacter agri]NML45036.1 hypothetical protein [Ramlibacter agri]